MKKIVFSIVALCLSFVLFGQHKETGYSISNTYYRINDASFDMNMGLFFLDSTLVLKSFEDGEFSKSDILTGRYIRQSDRYLLAPLHQTALFDVTCRQNPEVKKGKVRLTFDLGNDTEELYYAFRNDTLPEQSDKIPLDELIGQKRKYVVEQDAQTFLILEKKDGRDLFTLTYQIPDDANDLYIEYLGIDNKAMILYLFNVRHSTNPNELMIDFNVHDKDDVPPLIQAHYIRPVNESDTRNISIPFNYDLQGGYRYLDPVDFLYSKKPYDFEYSDYAYDDDDEEEETEKESGAKVSFTNADRWQLLHYNKTKLEPQIRANGKQVKQTAEDYFANAFKAKGDRYKNYGGGWYYFCEEFNSDTTDICPSSETLRELLDIYAEQELKRNKFDITAASIIYRYYTECFNDYDMLPVQLPASFLYFVKYAGVINEHGLYRLNSQEGTSTIWDTIRTLFRSVDTLNERDIYNMFEELSHLSPAYRDFLVFYYYSRYSLDYSMLTDYMATFKGWGIQQFRAHDEYLKRLEPGAYDDYLEQRDHPIGFCSALSGLLNEAAEMAYRNSWQSESSYQKEVLEWARLSTELCVPSNLPDYLDTYARLLYQSGDKEKALQIIELALRSLNEVQADQFTGEKIRINYELIKQKNLLPDRAWLE